MKRFTSLLFTVVCLALLLAGLTAVARPQHALAQSTGLEVLDRSGQAVTSLTDGNTIRLRLTDKTGLTAGQPVRFYLARPGSGQPGLLLGDCTPNVALNCQTEPFSTLGWYWESGGQALPERQVLAELPNGSVQSATIQVKPRPVVMVHGFSSSWEAWANYLGPQGYLTQVGIPGFAVGDGQVAGVMDTGSLAAPGGRTNTIAENAVQIRQYVERVRRQTGAERVDLLAHSMGGLISRYYIDRVMPEEEVAQLIMLGSPMAGTSCANLPAALGFYLPAALEIQPSYVNGIFNQQITNRHGAVIYALAGTPILDELQSPCTGVPSDIVISLESIQAIPLHLSQMPVLHIDLNTSEQVFQDYVLPLLQTPAGHAPVQPETTSPIAAAPAASQFSQIHTGHINPGASQELVIPIDPGVTVASFALYDSSRSLAVEVRGANGNLITLDPQTNGIVEVDDPEAMVHLGYGFANPRPGAWRVTLLSSAETPAEGADFALTARFKDGAQLEVNSSLLLPEQGQPVELTASLTLAGQPLNIASAEAVIRDPNGNQTSLPLTADLAAGQASATWMPEWPGLYSMEIRVRASSTDQMAVERSGFLAVEVQPPSNILQQQSMLLGAVLIVAVIFGGLLFGIWRQRQ